MNPVTVLILSHMLLLNYLDLRLYVCLNQNSVVLTKRNGALWAPFVLWCSSQFRVKLVKKKSPTYWAINHYCNRI